MPTYVRKYVKYNTSVRIHTCWEFDIHTITSARACTYVYTLTASLRLYVHILLLHFVNANQVHIKFLFRDHIYDGNRGICHGMCT